MRSACESCLAAIAPLVSLCNSHHAHILAYLCTYMPNAKSLKALVASTPVQNA